MADLDDDSTDRHDVRPNQFTQRDGVGYSAVVLDGRYSRAEVLASGVRILSAGSAAALVVRSDIQCAGPNMFESARRLLSRYSHLNWALADQTMISGVNFLSGILIARYLGVTEFGRFTLVWMAVLFANSLHHAMIIAPMMSIGPKQSEAEEPFYYGAVFTLQSLFAGLTFAALWLGAWAGGTLFPEWQMGGLAWPLAFVALAFQMQDFLRRYFFTRGRPRAAFANDAISYIGQITLLIGLFQVTTMDSSRVLWAIAATYTVAAVCSAFFVGSIDFHTATFRQSTLRHWRFSRWLAASAVMQWLSTNFFVIAAGAILGATAVGGLRAAQNLLGVTHILYMGLNNVVIPHASRLLHNRGKRESMIYLRHIGILGIASVGFIAVIFFAYPSFWLTLVYGADFANYGRLLQWYAVIYPILFLTNPLSAALQVLERTKGIFVSRLACAAFSVVAATPFIRLWGAEGAVSGLFCAAIILVTVLALSAVRSFHAYDENRQ